MDYRTLRLELTPPAARITLSRPDSANRLDRRFLRELADACEAIAATAGVVVTVVRADGADFCTGWDAEARRELLAERGQPGSDLVDPFGCLAALACPVVVGVLGAVRSAGLELALACDIRIASSDARFALPEVEEGSLPLAGGSQRLPRVVGRGLASAMLLLGEDLDAEAAYRAGLVSRVVAPDALDTEVDAIAARIASRGPLGLRYAKEAVAQGADLSLEQALRYELDLSVILQSTHDRAEGVNSFLETRPPNFEGR